VQGTRKEAGDVREGIPRLDGARTGDRDTADGATVWERVLWTCGGRYRHSESAVASRLIDGQDGLRCDLGCDDARAITSHKTGQD
jgi:hypothetical protein